jgi:DNA-binding response OmpR family regulator
VEVEDLLAENRALKEELWKVLDGQEALIQAEKRSSLGRLASGVAHELRNPLAVILARTQLLLMATRDGSGWSLERLEKSLKTMEGQTIRASKVIEKLSAYVRPRRPEAARAELNEVITEALEMVLDRVASDAIKVQTALTQAPTIVLGDRGQLHQVFVNLVLNALQAMPDGGTVTIGTEAQPSGDSTRFPLGMVVATVSDTGEGIPPDHVRKIFDPFFFNPVSGVWTRAQHYPGDRRGPQRRDPRRQRSRGRHHCRRRVSDRHPGPGSNQYGDERSMSNVLGKILVVDDEPEILDVLGDFFVSGGYEVVKASTGLEALAQFEQERPDLVLLDIRIPGVDGVEVLRRIRGLNPTVGIIMITANEDVELAKQLLALGAFDYVAKPFDFEYLDRAVFAWMMQGRKEERSVQPSSGDHHAADQVYALTLAIFRATRSLPAEARVSLGTRLESAAWSASARLLTQDRSGIIRALAEVELLLGLARDLGDLEGRTIAKLQAQLQATRDALGEPVDS